MTRRDVCLVIIWIVGFLSPAFYLVLGELLYMGYGQLYMDPYYVMVPVVLLFCLAACFGSIRASRRPRAIRRKLIWATVAALAFQLFAIVLLGFAMFGFSGMQ